MRKYEIMLILPAEAEDDLVSTSLDRITKVIAEHGGEVGDVDRWGKRRLAHELDRLTEGYYVVAEFTADPSDVRELHRVLQLADEVIRFKVTVRPEVERTVAAEEPSPPPAAVEEDQGPGREEAEDAEAAGREAVGADEVVS